MNVLDVIEGDDWAGLFVNGTLVYEGHSVRIDDIAKHVPIKSLARHCMNDAGLAIIREDTQFLATDIGGALRRYVINAAP